MSLILPTLSIRSAIGAFPTMEFAKPLHHKVRPIIQQQRPTFYTLVYEPGSRDTTRQDDGRWKETFRLFSNETDIEIIAAVKNMRKMFETAKRLAARNSFDDEIKFWDRAQNEELARAAIIYSGDIVKVDHPIVKSDLSRGAAIFLVTIERDAFEHQNQVGGTLKTWNAFENHGGYRFIDTGSTTGDQPARIESFIINSMGGELDRAWIGFKAATAGELRDSDLNEHFDPEIDAESGELATGAEGGVVLNDTSFINNSGVYIMFFSYQSTNNDDSAWRLRWEFPINKWNAATATASNLPYFLGEYYLLLRYKTDDIGDAQIGIRAATGYRGNVNNTYLERHYLGTTDGEFRYYNLGKIRVGGEGWTQDLRNRAYLQSFRVKIEAALINGDYRDKPKFYIDNMYLVPADHYLYFKMEKPIASGARVELYQRYDMTVDGVVVERHDDDGPGPLTAQRQIFFTINEIKAENWAWPVELGSVLVFVGDRPEPRTKAVSATNIIQVAIVRRSTDYS